MVLPLAIVCCHSSLAAPDINWDELEEKAKKYTSEHGSKVERIPDNVGQKLNLSIPSQPLGRIIDGSMVELSESDKNYITVHMKLANRHFAKKNYQRAIEEVELVFEKQPDHAGGRFMRAVIAARMKDHAAAWHNIIIAREKDGQNAKVVSFIEKLKTVSPEPEKTPGVPGIYRPIPVSAAEKAADIIERLLQHPISQNITMLAAEELAVTANTAFLTLSMESSAALDKDEIRKLMIKSAGGNVEIVPPTVSENVDKQLKLKIAIPGLEIKNKNVKPVSELPEFIKSLTEEIDVAISDTVEREAENRILDTTYEISVRDFRVLNDFLRKISPYAHEYRILSMKLAYITGSQSIIWKCKVQVMFQQT